MQFFSVFKVKFK